jgi:NitT/TauT family transport system ATP-binding protein
MAAARAAEAPALEMKAVTRRFPARLRGAAPFTAIERLSFHVSRGEFVALVGPSGCGKSTVLNLVAGLDRASEGEVFLAGERVTGPSFHVGFMLQKDLLLPWRSIRRNVEFGLEARGLTAEERAGRIERELRRCRLTEYADRYPHQLSGASARRWPAPWRSSRTWSCWTSPSARWMRRPRSCCSAASPRPSPRPASPRC